MGNRDFNYRRMWGVALLAWFVGGIGGISIDFDHILSTATEGAVPWAFLHQPITIGIFIGGVIASMGGLVISLVLRSEN